MHPSYEMDREYAVRVRGEVTDEMIENLKNGVMLEDGPARFTDIKQAPQGDGFNHWFHCVVMEGRNREVRRLWESQGLVVSRLKRVRFGPVFLTADLSVGRWREMGQGEVDILAAEVGLKPLALPGMKGKAREKLDRMQRKSGKPVAEARQGGRGTRDEARGDNRGRGRGDARGEGRGQQGTPLAERPADVNRGKRPGKAARGTRQPQPHRAPVAQARRRRRTRAVRSRPAKGSVRASVAAEWRSSPAPWWRRISSCPALSCVPTSQAVASCGTISPRFERAAYAFSEAGRQSGANDR